MQCFTPCSPSTPIIIAADAQAIAMESSVTRPPSIFWIKTVARVLKIDLGCD